MPPRVATVKKGTIASVDEDIWDLFFMTVPFLQKTMPRLFQVGAGGAGTGDLGCVCDCLSSREGFGGCPVPRCLSDPSFSPETAPCGCT